MIIERMLYSALMERRVVSVPVPAIKGKASGTTEAALGMVSLLICIPRIISKATMKMRREPAMAKSPIEMPIISSIEFPTNKNTIIIASDTHEAFRASMLPAFCRTDIITGIEPIISMTAKRTIETFNISIRLKTIAQN